MVSQLNVASRLRNATSSVRISLAGLLMVVSLVQPALSVAQAASRAVPAMTCSALTGFSASNVQILTATYHIAAGTLPAYCNVVGVIDRRVTGSTNDASSFVCRSKARRIT